jgi:hypothetical protein
VRILTQLCGTVRALNSHSHLPPSMYIYTDPNPDENHTHSAKNRRKDLSMAMPQKFSFVFPDNACFSSSRKRPAGQNFTLARTSQRKHIIIHSSIQSSFFLTHLLSCIAFLIWKPTPAQTRVNAPTSRRESNLNPPAS